MLSRVRIAAVLVLCFPYVMSLAQGLAGLLGAPGVPETLSVSEIPADFRAVDIHSSASDFSQAMEMSMYSLGSLGAKDSFDFYQYVQTSWTAGKTISTDAGVYLVTYRLGFSPPADPGSPPRLGDTLRLSLVRKDSIIEISPRSDLTVARLKELLAPQAQGGRESAPAKTEALSNVKQLALGMIMYAGDYDDNLPYVQDSKSAFAVTMPYLKNESLTKSLNPAGSRILMNMAVAGVEMTSVQAPAETILLYDEKPWPDGRHLVAFMDGHAKFVEADEWTTVERTLHSKLKRKGKPLPPDYWKKLAGPKGLGT